jgi:phosphoribosylaminoimidazolecarboxamide formyltransferase/IMP cyclohydrolase
MAIGCALLSVSDKTGLLPLARALAGRGITLLSTGGTERALREAGVEVTAIELYTGSPEVMDGRVKTLHPRVHGGILMRGEKDLADLARLGGRPIDLVVVNLYPFEKTAAEAGAEHDRIIENIDVGGPSMLRAAAKNHERVAVVCDPADYEVLSSEIEARGEVSLATRKRLAAKAFAHTAAYDGAIAGYLSSLADDGQRERFPRFLTLSFERASGLRYGENPHQAAAFYRETHAPPGSLALAASIGQGGKELGFNNLIDAHAALEAVREFSMPAAVLVKHQNPCGVAAAEPLAEAYRAAREADSVSAFGCVAALNREVDTATAGVIAQTFVECVVAPSFSPEALELLHAKKNLRILATGVVAPADEPAFELRQVSGGVVLQSRDATAAGEVRRARVATKRQPTEAELASLDFAWCVAKHVKSNAIVLAKGLATVGVGAGQMSRVTSVQIACDKAGPESRGSVLASDAYFPFPDGVELAIARGITAIAQPGGSVKDADVVAVADRAGIAMLFTGVRHFRH